jgi:hypothetical protein
MGQVYKQCTACGARALRIATRCPGCHREFPSADTAARMSAGQRMRRPNTRRPAGLAAGVLVVAALVILTELGQSNGVPTHTGPTTAADSVPAEVGYVSNGATVDPALATAPAPAAPSRPEFRVAQTWTHVRKAPRKSAELEAVLTPGDTVLADSLQQGWYRVALDGEVLGYAYQTALSAAVSSGSRSAPTP